MATTALTQDFKRSLLEGGHNFKTAGIAYKMLLIKLSPAGTYNDTLSNVGTPGTGTPSPTNVGTDEVTGPGYTTGGFALTNVNPALSSGVATTSFAVNPNWTGATFSATKRNLNSSIVFLTFGSSSLSSAFLLRISSKTSRCAFSTYR